MACHRIMDVVKDGEALPHQRCRDRPDRTGHTILAGSVDSVWLSPFKSMVTVTGPDKLIPLRTKVKALAETTARIKVG